MSRIDWLNQVWNELYAIYGEVPASQCGQILDMMDLTACLYPEARFG